MRRQDDAACVGLGVRGVQQRVEEGRRARHAAAPGPVRELTNKMTVKKELFILFLKIKIQN